MKRECDGERRIPPKKNHLLSHYFLNHFLSKFLISIQFLAKKTSDSGYFIYGFEDKTATTGRMV